MTMEWGPAYPCKLCKGTGIRHAKMPDGRRVSYQCGKCQGTGIRRTLTITSDDK